MKLAEALQERADLNRKLEELMARINRTNAATVDGGETVTALIARRDALTQQVRAYRDAVNWASQTGHRARGTAEGSNPFGIVTPPIAHTRIDTAHRAPPRIDRRRGRVRGILIVRFMR